MTKEFYVIRCPHCARAMGTQAKKVTSCPFCHKAINLTKIYKAKTDRKGCAELVKKINQKLAKEVRYNG